MAFLDETTVATAISALRGSADHLFKIWLALKHMGLAPGEPPVRVDTSNSTPSLSRLFGNTLLSGEFFVPFAKTRRFLTMKSDASRSIVQTTIQRWASSGSVVTVDPSNYINFHPIPSGEIEVSLHRRYPMGLGYGKAGFSPKNDASLSVPIGHWAAWYCRVTEIPDAVNSLDWIIDRTLGELHIDTSERELIFSDESLSLSFRDEPLSLEELDSICQRAIDSSDNLVINVDSETLGDYTRRVQMVTDNLEKPVWLRTDPSVRVRRLIDQGHSAILLYGPPRTGKTRIVDSIRPRLDPTRITIQIHDGWSYEHLIQGLKPNDNGDWTWTAGPLLNAIRDGKTFIVLEEANRTVLSQALGEVFSLIETAYRGENYAITLRNGDLFWIPAEVTLIFTFNTVDRSTEDIDDAFLGRVAAVECPPSSMALSEILESQDIQAGIKKFILRLFQAIQSVYPLGHGYFTDIKISDSAIGPVDVIDYYVGRIRPVLHIALGEVYANELTNIDNIVNELAE